MKELTDDEFHQTPLIGKGKCSPFYVAIIGLKKGKGLFISKAEWYLGDTPGRICRHIMKKFKHVKYDYGMRPDKTGWEIRRME